MSDQLDSESGSVASCVRCGERINGVMALTATLCGLCADDELNERAREEKQKALPRKFYWSQCYELDGKLHWALKDTLTDNEPPPRVTCLEMILEAHAPDIFGRPLEGEYFPKLIVELLNAHFAPNAPVERPANVRQLCQTHPEVNYKTAWGCPECVRVMRSMLTAASNALRSYQYGNTSPDLAESVANRIDITLSPNSGLSETSTTPDPR